MCLQQVESTDQILTAIQEEHSNANAEAVPPVQLQLLIKEPAITLQLHITEPLHQQHAEEHTQLKQAFQTGEEHIQELQCQLELARANNESLSAQLDSGKREVQELSSTLADTETQLAYCRVTIQEMEEGIEGSGLTACEQDLLLRQCLEVAKVQQELDSQVYS